MHAPNDFRHLLGDAKFRRLVEALRSMGSVAVAYSGGADSAFLLKVAHAVLGERAHGVLAVSESLDRYELAGAEQLASSLGLPLSVVETHEYSNDAYRQNDSDRCYHCKKELFDEVRAFAERRGIPHVLDGSHAGDVGDYRPGLRARNEAGVASPLMEAGIDKEDIRRFSKALGLPTWNKPAAPCLSSRIPYGTEITEERLRQVETAEKALRDLGFRTVRVRHHGQVARIEVPAGDLERVLGPDVRQRVSDEVRAAGFLYVTVDVDGFRSGSLNAALGTGAVPVGPLVQLDRPRPAG